MHHALDSELAALSMLSLCLLDACDAAYSVDVENDVLMLDSSMCEGLL